MNSVLLSILMHLVLLSGFSFVWLSHSKPEEKPSLYIPSYTYNEEASASTPQQAAPSKAIEKPQSGSGEIAMPENREANPNPVSHASHASPNSEAIHMVGDKKKVPKPLVKILGRAITAHLVYPKIAQDFQLKGVVYVGFTLYPDGHMTNIQVVQSSLAGVLDEQAISAVTLAGPLKNISALLTEPKEMVIGIIFR